MAPKKKTAAFPKPKPAATKRKAAEIDASREVRRKAAATVAEPLKPVSHPSHGKIPGHIFVFGDGDCGQLGLGEDVTERLRPFPVDIDGEKAIQVVCGGMHTVALMQDDSIYSWGVNDEGALGRETTGELWEKSGLSTNNPGDAYTPGRIALPKEAGKIIQLSAGDSHTCALTELGAVWAWGTYRDSSGVMGFGPHTRIQLTPVCVYTPKKAEEQVVRIASGADHTLALLSSGAVLSWGNGQQGQLGRVGERMSDRAKMATLLEPHPVPIRRARGAGKSTKIIDINCGTYASFVITADGSVYTCGLNNYGQLALDKPEPVYAFTHIKALEGKDIALVRSGQHHTLIITKEGHLLSFGRPTYGRLGQKDADVAADSACPTVKAVDGIDGVDVIGAAAGLAVSGCFSKDGTVWMWGFGTSNQLGKGEDDEDEIVPRKLAEAKKYQNQKAVQLEFGGQHVAMLCVDK